MPRPPRGVLHDALRLRNEAREAAAAAAWDTVVFDSDVVKAIRPPAFASTRRGQLLRRAPQWRLHRLRFGSDKVTVPVVRLWYPEMRLPDLSLAPAGYGPTIATAAYFFCRERASDATGGSIRSLLGSFVALARYASTVAVWNGAPGPIALFSREHLNAFARWCDQRTPMNPDVHPGNIHRFVRWAVDRGVPGFTRALARATYDVYVRAHLNGHIARLGHPTKGALVEQERLTLLRSMDNPHAEHDPLDWALVRLCWETGVRPVQAAALTWGALMRSVGPADACRLRVPRAKRRDGAGRGWSERTLSPGLYERLCALRPVGAAETTPIFPGDRGIDLRMRDWARLHRLETHRDPALAHRRGKPRRSRVIDGVRVWPLRLTAYRLRRTLATRLAEAGAGAQTIVAALDDDTLAMATIYAANTPSLVEALRDTLDTHPHWLRVVRLFAGTAPVKPREELPVIVGGAVHLATPARHARTIGIIGRCANPVACLLFPPLDCYGCAHFEAERDPVVHRRQLDQVIDELAAKVGVQSDRMGVIFKRVGIAISELVVKLERSAARPTERAVAAQQARLTEGARP